MTIDDPSREPGRWDRLFGVLRDIDTEIERLYERNGKGEIRSRFARPLLRLADGGPRTITELAAELDATHSATSQTVEAMKRAGLVESRPGTDARTRVLALTPAGEEAVPLVAREWRATEATVAELDDELSLSLDVAAAELRKALDARSARERLSAQFDALGASPGGSASTDVETER